MQDSDLQDRNTKTNEFPSANPRATTGTIRQHRHHSSNPLNAPFCIDSVNKGRLQARPPLTSLDLTNLPWMPLDLKLLLENRRRLH
jgi:hypothetical protein